MSEQLSREEALDEIETLKKENRAQEERITDQEYRIEALSTRLERVVAYLADEPDDFYKWDLDEMETPHDRLKDVEDRVTEHDDRLAMFLREDGTDKKPDERAELLRQTLWQKAKTNDGYARLKRDECDARLGGGNHPGTLMDAMRRAADGRDADIQGTSNLKPIPAISLSVASSKDEQSHLELDRDDLTHEDVRQNLMMESSGTRGSR